MKKIILLMFILMFVPLVSSQFQQLTSYHSFDDLNDYFRVNNFTNNQGAVNFKVGRVGNAVNTTTDNNIISKTSTSFDLTAPNRSLNLWVHPYLNAGSHILAYAIGGRRIEKLTGGFVYLTGLGNPEIAQTTGNISFNNWSMLTIVNNDTNTSFYFNGVLNRVSGITTGTPSNYFYLGVSEDNTTDFNGLIDEMGFWNRTLNSSDVSFLWNSGFGSPLNASVSLLTPSDNYNLLQASSLNFSASMLPVSFQNSINATLHIWYANGTLLNQTKNNVTGISLNYTNWTIYNLQTGSYVWNVLGCFVSTCLFASSNRSITVGLIENSQTYNSSVYSSSVESFSINISYNSTVFLSSSATLTYNGTSYVGTASVSGGEITFSAVVPIPSVTTQTNNTFYWTIGLYNGSTTVYINSGVKSQIVLLPFSFTVTSGVCSAGLNPSFYFDFADEPTRVKVNASINYNFQYGYSGNTTLIISSGNFTNVYNFTVCINSSVPSYSVGYGEIQYYNASSALRRFYIFQNTRLTNETVNNTLFLLSNSLATQFQITAQDNLFNLERNKFISLLRWYPEINSYKVVEMGLTDNNGQTVFSLVTNDVDYRRAIYELDGTLIYLFPASRFVCQTSPCTDTMTVPSSAISLQDTDDIQQSLTFNRTSKIFTFVWNDPSQSTTTMNLTVYRDSYDQSIIICSTSSSTFTGVLVCDVSAYTGSLRAEVYRSSSPPQWLTSLLVNIGSALSDTATGKTIGLFFAFLLFIVAFIIGLYNPIIAIVMGIVALVPAMYVGVISITVFIGFILVGGLIVHFLRRS